MTKDLIDLLTKIATAILTIYGLFALPLDVIDKTKSNVAGVILAIIIVIVFGITAIYHFTPPLTLKRFGVGRHKTKPILSYDKEVVEIDKNFKAVIKTDKTLIYPEQPFSSDLVDIIEVSKSEKIDEKVYVTTDSTVEKFVRKKDNTLAVFWQPLSRIIPFVPYNHKTMYHCPSNYGEDAFWQSFHVDLDTGIVDWTFNCSHNVESAIAFQLPYLNTKITYEKLHWWTFVRKKRDCPQPVIVDNLTVNWKLIGPKKNRSFVCVVFYENGEKIFRNMIKKYKWYRRLIS